MTSKQLALQYFSATIKGDWEKLISNEITYYLLDTEKALDYETCIKGAGQFYSLCTGLKTIQIIESGNNVSAINRYDLKSPSGNSISMDAAEFFTFDDSGKVSSLAIFFDSKGFQEFLSN